MSTATEMLAKYLTAEQAVLEGKTVKFGERLLGMEELSEIRAGRQEWERTVASATAGANAPRLGGIGFSVARMD